MPSSRHHNLDIILAISLDLPTWAFPAELLNTGTFNCMVFFILATRKKHTFFYFNFLTDNVDRKRTM